MSLLYIFKPQKDRVLRPIAGILLKVGVTPNMVTAAGLLASAAAGLRSSRDDDQRRAGQFSQ